MREFPIALWLFTLIFLAAGMVKGVTGMGLPTVAMGLLGTAMPPSMAAAMLVLPSFITNVWQLLAGAAKGRHQAAKPSVKAKAPKAAAAVAKAAKAAAKGKATKPATAKAGKARSKA